MGKSRRFSGPGGNEDTPRAFWASFVAGQSQDSSGGANSGSGRNTDIPRAARARSWRVNNRYEEPVGNDGNRESQNIQDVVDNVNRNVDPNTSEVKFRKRNRLVWMNQAFTPRPQGEMPAGTSTAVQDAYNEALGVPLPTAKKHRLPSWREIALNTPLPDDDLMQESGDSIVSTIQRLRASKKRKNSDPPISVISKYNLRPRKNSKAEKDNGWPAGCVNRVDAASSLGIDMLPAPMETHGKGAQHRS